MDINRGHDKCEKRITMYGLGFWGYVAYRVLWQYDVTDVCTSVNNPAKLNRPNRIN